MILRPDQIKLLAQGRPAAPCNLGGKSDSNSSTSTQEADQRNNVGSGVGATASSGGTVNLNVSQLDDGAISGAFGLASSALQGVEGFGTASMSASAHTAELAINGVLDSEQGVRQAYADATQQAISATQSASQQVASAYQDAKTNDQKTMMVGLMVIAGAAVLLPFLMKEAA